MKTMICLILDRSGSMKGRESDVIGGVNTFLEEQKKLPDAACITMVRFDDPNAIERFRPMQDLAKCEPLTEKDYSPRSSTALLDAVGSTIVKLDEDWKTEKPERCLVMIVTDGEENASSEYTKEKVKALIKARTDSNLWSFVYLGADVDAFAEAGSMGISMSNSAGFTKSAMGIKKAFKRMSDYGTTLRTTGNTVADNLGVSNLGEEEDPVPESNPGWTPPTDKPADDSWKPPF